MRTIILATAAGLLLSGGAFAQTMQSGSTQNGASLPAQGRDMPPIESSNGAAIGTNGGLRQGVGTAERDDNMLQKGPLGSNSEGGGSNGGSNGTGASQ